MFLCPKCNSTLESFKCTVCGYAIPIKDKIWQFTSEPDIITDGDGDKYIGYEKIGESYLCRKSWSLTENEYSLPKIISDIVGDGIMLDIGCGDGVFTVPCASFGSRIIAGDISCKMLSLLKKLAKTNNISLNNVTLTRMNALHIPLSDNSVDVVIANSMLHVVSAPEKVVSEIYRVLKPSGKFICFSDAPGKTQPNKSNKYDNSRIGEIFTYFHSNYWDYLRSNGIKQVHYSWKFNRDACCMKLFSAKEEQIYEYETPYTETSLHEYSFPRTKGRGWSDQVVVPDDLHQIAYYLAMKNTYEKYGDEVDTARYCEGCITKKKTLTLYIK